MVARLPAVSVFLVVPLFMVQGALSIAVTTQSSAAVAGCSFQGLGEGRVQAAIDGRGLRLDDGREVRLAAIEIPFAKMEEAAILAAVSEGRKVRLEGPEDGPDRYGRQTAFVHTDGTGTSLQAELLGRGAALYDGSVTEAGCARELRAAEAAARNGRLGLWADPTAIKNAEKPDDIAAAVGQFAVIEGKAQSVRQSGTTFYVNFGRRWTEGFAATISRRMIAPMEAAGMAPKALEGRRIRVRGVVERRIGPRIDIVRVGQIELVD
jgi:endonuclease YncB( thermonuclease family)